MYVSLLLCLARIYTHSTTSTHLLTPRPVPRLPADFIHALDTNPFFNSLPSSSLNFLERSTFTSKPRKEKTAFMEGLDSVLDRFSEGLWGRKILPSLPEEVVRPPILEHRQGLNLLQMKDSHLLPSTLSNVFSISTGLSPSQSALQVLPSLNALFAVKGPSQNMMTLLSCCRGGAISQSFGSTSCRWCTTS